MIVIATLSLASPALAAPAAWNRDFAGVVFPFYTHIAKHDVRAMKKAHVRSVRLPLYWHAAEPQKGTFTWTSPDSIVGALASKGISVQLMPQGAPLWANGRTVAGVALDGQTQTTPPLGSPSAEHAWQNFVSHAVERYGAGGSYWSHEYRAAYPGKPAVPVHIWQVWNEPNIPGQFDGSPNPVKYAELVKLASTAIRAVDPTAEVSLAGLPAKVSFPGRKFLDELYRALPKKFFDLVAFHPYTSNRTDLRTQMRRFRRVMIKHDDGKTGIWVSEVGYGSADPDGHLNKGMDGQAKYLKTTMKMLAKHRRAWGVVRVSWFDWKDPRSYAGDCTWCAAAGLFDSEGHAKPAFRAYQAAVRGLDRLASAQR
jgi:hypothetical protein